MDLEVDGTYRAFDFMKTDLVISKTTFPLFILTSNLTHLIALEEKITSLADNNNFRGRSRSKYFTPVILLLHWNGGSEILHFFAYRQEIKSPHPVKLSVVDGDENMLVEDLRDLVALNLFALAEEERFEVVLRNAVIDNGRNGRENGVSIKKGRRKG
ncbi:6260_t:CDS:2 [Paraglomus occultum]|uniref:6260_t:CDS:1 n=1 Tax=Paraglomus occultum TaxID=144539 RepID=A0A9N8WCW0_9GLOM|nr:6260_t:CDS:2 [Paraglomus occultum]